MAVRPLELRRDGDRQSYRLGCRRAGSAVLALVLVLEPGGLAVKIRRAIMQGRLLTVRLGGPWGGRLSGSPVGLALPIEGPLSAVSGPVGALTLASMLLVQFLVRAD